jgi:hypothetical protein
MHHCNKCHLEKDDGDFYILEQDYQNTKAGGLVKQCRKCTEKQCETLKKCCGDNELTQAHGTQQLPLVMFEDLLSCIKSYQPSSLACSDLEKWDVQACVNVAGMEAKIISPSIEQNENDEDNQAALVTQ